MVNLNMPLDVPHTKKKTVQSAFLVKRDFNTGVLF